MNPGRSHLGRTHVWGLALASIVAVALLHWPVINLGHQPDSLLMIRPWTWSELRASLTGTWLFSSVDNYHRPLTTLITAADFAAFGLNSRALHVVSLLTVSVACWLLGCWLWLEAGSAVAVAGMAVYLTHPVLLDSSIAGPYQYHILSAAIVAATLWLWASRRHAMTLRCWWPMLVLPVVGFYLKEDTIMVLPAILLLQSLRARMCATCRGPLGRSSAPPLRSPCGSAPSGGGCSPGSTPPTDSGIVWEPRRSGLRPTPRPEPRSGCSRIASYWSAPRASCCCFKSAAPDTRGGTRNREPAGHGSADSCSWWRAASRWPSSWTCAQRG